jgi:hypothetical protein
MKAKSCGRLKMAMTLEAPPMLAEFEQVYAED